MGTLSNGYSVMCRVIVHIAIVYTKKNGAKQIACVVVKWIRI